MDKKLKRFNYLRILLDILYFVFIIMYALYLVDNIMIKIHIDDFFVLLCLFVIVYCVVYYLIYTLLIIGHEFGHLVMGRKAGLKFIAFNVFSYSFTVKGGKLRVKKEAKIPGVRGYCNMTTESKKKYDKKAIKLYYMGGILFNIIAFLVSLLFILIIDNIYVDAVLLLSLGMNLYAALYNLVPAELKAGTPTDALHYLNYLEDSNYLELVSNVQRIQLLLASGVELKDIDEKLFMKIDKIKYKGEVINALIYIDYIVSKEKYNEAIDYINDLMENSKDILSQNDNLTLRIQLINCYFYINELDSIKDVWDKKLKEYLDIMGKISPVFIVVNYMYYSLIEVNNREKKKYLEQFNKVKDNFYDKNTINDCIEYIEEVDKKVK